MISENAGQVTQTWRTGWLVKFESRPAPKFSTLTAQFSFEFSLANLLMSLILLQGTPEHFGRGEPY